MHVYDLSEEVYLKNHYTNEVTRYETLREFIQNHTYYFLEQLEENVQRMAFVYDHYSGSFYPQSTFRVFDSYHLPIPRSALLSIANSLGKNDKSYWKRYDDIGTPVHRRDPVHGTGKNRFKWVGFRSFKYVGHKREWADVHYDEHCQQYGIKGKAKQKYHVDIWDDVRRKWQRCWKSQRKNQWKIKKSS